MKFHILIFLILIGLLNCKRDQAPIDIQSNGLLTLIDSSTVSKSNSFHSSYNDANYYPIYYAGNEVDTLHLSKKPIWKSNYESKYVNEHLLPQPDSSNFELYVDTSIILNFNVPYLGFYSGHEYHGDSSLKNKSFPIFLRNKSDSLLNIYFCWDIRNIIRQAKNVDGKWIDYEKPTKLLCGTGCSSIIIEPHEIILSKLLIFNGNHRAECRLKFIGIRQEVYSNTFYDYIDEKLLTESL